MRLQKTWILNPVLSKCVFPRRRPPKIASSMGVWQASAQRNSLCRWELAATASSSLPASYGWQGEHKPMAAVGDVRYILLSTLYWAVNRRFSLRHRHLRRLRGALNCFDRDSWKIRPFPEVCETAYLRAGATTDSTIHSQALSPITALEHNVAHNFLVPVCRRALV